MTWTQPHVPAGGRLVPCGGNTDKYRHTCVEVFSDTPKTNQLFHFTLNQNVYSFALTALESWLFSNAFIHTRQ